MLRYALASPSLCTHVFTFLPSSDVSHFAGLVTQLTFSFSVIFLIFNTKLYSLIFNFMIQNKRKTKHDVFWIN